MFITHIKTSRIKFSNTYENIMVLNWPLFQFKYYLQKFFNNLMAT